MDTQLYNSPPRNPRSPRITVGYKTDKGHKRSGNEDSYAVFSGEDLNPQLAGMFVVADGMGGTKGGEIASNIVVNSLPEAVQSLLAERTLDGPPHEYALLLNNSIQRANADVWKYKLEHEGLEQMGTTCVAALIAHLPAEETSQKTCLVLANVGDSRAYLLRQGRLSQMTEDHSEVAEQVKAGNMTPEEARTSRFRNTITRHIGQGSTVSPDITIRELFDGDVLLLCSDGLTTEVDDLAIARMLADSATPQGACDRLVDAALKHGGSDNITVVVVHYGAFIPLALAGPSREPLKEQEAEDEEEITDPNQAWKRSLAPGSTARREVPDESDRYASASRGSYDRNVAVPRRGVSPLLFSLLLIVAIAEGVGLYLFWAGQIKLKPLPPKPQIEAAKPTDKPLAYGPAALIYGKPLWEGALHLMPDGRLLVVTQTGQELAVTPGGTATVLGNTVTPPAPLVQSTLRKDGSMKPAPIPTMITVDASGYRYELNPHTRAIDKYDPSGVIQTRNIGTGELKSPTNLVVDKSGSLYVIDEHKLKRIPATLDTGTTAAPSTPDATQAVPDTSSNRKPEPDSDSANNK